MLQCSRQFLAAALFKYIIIIIIITRTTKLFEHVKLLRVLALLTVHFSLGTVCNAPLPIL